MTTQLTELTTQLTTQLTAATTDAAAALKEHGEYSREYRVADEIRRRAERSVSAARQRAEKDERLAGMTPRQIVDEAMER